MSSEDDQPGALPSPAKKRRVQRACDMCRRKKSRSLYPFPLHFAATRLSSAFAGDGLRMSGKKCTNCTDSGLECTFAGTVAKRRSYVEALESRLEMTEQLLRKASSIMCYKAVSPISTESPNNVNGNSWSADSPVLRHGELAVTPSGGGEAGPGVLIAALNLRSMNLPAPVPHGDDLAHIALLEDFSNLSITQARNRFQGKSSGAMLVKAAVQLREGYEERDIPWSSRRSHYWSFNPVRAPFSFLINFTRNKVLTPSQTFREKVKYRVPHTGPFIFPQPDLLSSLVDLYFKHKNLYFPVLHRPTFARALVAGLHERDTAFGAVVLLVCAIGSRFSSDPRVSRARTATGERNGERGGEEGEGKGKGDELRCGWEFFDQLPWMLDHLFERPSVYHLQYYCLATSFLEFSAPASCWTLIGIGIRLAQDLGVHRQRDPGIPKSAEGELWKRGFWVLVSYDRMVSMVLGRSCATHFEDIDADLPIECDDEYWPGESGCSDDACPITPTTPTAETTNGVDTDVVKRINGTNMKETLEPWTQPPGKPSCIAFFNAFLRLNNILAFGLKMLYALNKTKMLLAHRDAQWEEHLVMELDSALNGWVDSIPAHLSWDPNRRDEAFFDQSALLYCNYYQVQISIHRPFIPAISGGAPTALPSLAICTNAARSCSHIADISRIRRDGVPVPVLISSVFTSGVILLLNVWSGKRTGLPPHLNSAITEVHKCMKAIRVCEKRWQTAGLYYDLLSELATIGQVPLPKEPSRPAPSTNNTQSQKRAREEDDVGRYGAVMPVQHPPYDNTFQPAPSTVPPESQSQTAQSLSPPANDTGWMFGVSAALGLPMYGGDLGRLPVFHQSQNTDLISQPAASASCWQSLGFPDFTVPVAAGADTTDSMANAFNTFGADGLGVFGGAESNGNSSGFAPGQGAGADGMGSDTMAMWANAPMGFEVDDWGTYFSVMNEMNLNVGADIQGSGSSGRGGT
ncbi:fungal-specific transcription factor domain-containing protein [Mycena vitilis]|nr:fungal-specific transcription factor domain-containing protein [Mycena vitilis]